MAEVTFEFSIFAHGGSGDMETDVELSDKMVKRLSRYIEKHEDDGEDFKDVEELSDIYEIVDAAVIDTIAESLQEFPEGFEEDLEENDVDVSDMESVKEFVVNELEYSIEWPCI